jgi:hypothetical protein
MVCGVVSLFDSGGTAVVLLYSLLYSHEILDVVSVLHSHGVMT